MVAILKVKYKVFNLFFQIDALPKSIVYAFYSLFVFRNPAEALKKNKYSFVLTYMTLKLYTRLVLGKKIQSK